MSANQTRAEAAKARKKAASEKIERVLLSGPKTVMEISTHTNLPNRMTYRLIEELINGGRVRVMGSRPHTKYRLATAQDTPFKATDGKTIDGEILDLLAQQGRVHSVSIAPAIHRPEPIVRERLRKLRQAGAILWFRDGVKACYALADSLSLDELDALNDQKPWSIKEEPSEEGGRIIRFGDTWTIRPGLRGDPRPARGFSSLEMR